MVDSKGSRRGFLLKGMAGVGGTLAGLVLPGVAEAAERRIAPPRVPPGTERLRPQLDARTRQALAAMGAAAESLERDASGLLRLRRDAAARLDLPTRRALQAMVQAVEEQRVGISYVTTDGTVRTVGKPLSAEDAEDLAAAARSTAEALGIRPQLLPQVYYWGPIEVHTDAPTTAPLNRLDFPAFVAMVTYVSSVVGYPNIQERMTICFVATFWELVFYYQYPVQPLFIDYYLPWWGYCYYRPWGGGAGANHGRWVLTQEWA